ncbi:MAG: hypothetical protein ACTSXW_03920 [Candidatus Baldrarchaeia archaeon]
MTVSEKHPIILLHKISDLIKKIVRTVLSEYPDKISSKYPSLETYFPSAEKVFNEYLSLTERLKFWFKVRMQLCDAIKGIVKTMDTIDDNSKDVLGQVQALILPEYKRLLDLLLEDLRFAKEISTKIHLLDVISENCRKAGIRSQFHLKISGYSMDEHTDEIEQALIKISEGKFEEAEKIIIKIKQRLKQLQYE